MGGRQIRPAGVYRAVSQELQHHMMPGYRVPEPPWFAVMNSVPPAESLVRNVAPRHVSGSGAGPRAKKPKKMYRPQRIRYLEDALRTSFYKDHPWELARPRIVMELDGKDYQHCDWGTGLRQPGVPLNGECVVQRQLWLMENGLARTNPETNEVEVEKVSRRKAYDMARQEFYRLRQAEDIERRVAVEEARHVGAYFGKTRLDVGMQLEDQEFENWKVWAGKETANREARANADVETFGAEEEEEGGVDGEANQEGEREAQSVPASS
ncbi:37S ribosomal protein S25 [Escovopsis weberi]|uniref:Small ribosomal subunit protein mS23 n=1 Tax=Escovopsis weberi TaxID=150374 RepID=A0A0M9VSW4_ESCWE|nr:37S ribosomal protein S25 [Escovopsis weberi]